MDLLKIRMQLYYKCAWAMEWYTKRSSISSDLPTFFCVILYLHAFYDHFTLQVFLSLRYVFPWVFYFQDMWYTCDN